MKKINQILQIWPQATLITTDWLKKQGVSRQSVDNYKKSGWLEQVSHGVYKRKDEKVAWEGGLYALQKLQDVPVHVGGKTALEAQGLGHYGRMGSNRVVLWKNSEARLPNWFQKYDWKVDMHVCSATLFAKDDTGLTTKQWNQIPITISTAERAMLEYLYEVPRQEGFDEANYIMENLASLRPKILQKLLEDCKSIRAKRLFMYLAEYHNHRWFKRIDSSTIDFGKGKREIIKGGTLDKKYKIVIPKSSREDR